MLDCMLLEFLRAELGFGAEMQFRARPENEGKLEVGGDQSLDSRESPDPQPVPRGPQGLKWHLFPWFTPSLGRGTDSPASGNPSIFYMNHFHNFPLASV